MAMLDLDDLVAEARGFLAAAEAEGTRRNYATDWRAFVAWCAGHGFESLPADPDVVALYLTDYARPHKASTAVGRIAPFALILAVCPLMMFLMMRGMSHGHIDHAGHQGHPDDRAPADKPVDR